MKKNYALLTLAALFLAACTAGPDGGESVDPNSGDYSITLKFERDDQNEELTKDELETAGVSVSANKRRSAGVSFTLTVDTPLLQNSYIPEGEIVEGEGDGDGDGDGDGGGGGSDPVYWFVKNINARYTTEGGGENANVGYKYSGTTYTADRRIDRWTFTMPGGDLTIKITFSNEYPDENNVFLKSLSSSAGTMSGFSRERLDYTMTVPYSTVDFSIFAEAENPFITPVLTKNGLSPSENVPDNLLATNLIAPPPEGGKPTPEYCLTKASSDYTITVTSENGAIKIFNITVILLPDLSLAGLNVKYTYDSREIVRELPAWMNTHTVYVPATTATVQASPSASPMAVIKEGATRSVDNLKTNVPKPVTLTVSNPQLDLSSDYSEMVYTVNLYYVENLNPVADGGYVSFIPYGAGAYYETHMFVNLGENSFLFTDDRESVEADILIVGGGGGSGRGTDARHHFPGGGGAGGLLYETAYPLALPGGSVSVVVGAGAPGRNKRENGADGGDSWIENDANLFAPGGGGGGGSNAWGDADTYSGCAGGSGGGGGYNSNSGGPGGEGKSLTAASAASRTVPAKVLGYAGGAAPLNPSNGYKMESSLALGGGGGGAGGPGESPTTRDRALGGPGWKPSENNAPWIYDITGVEEFSKGGKGGAPGLGGENGVNYGDGASANCAPSPTPGKGHSGIVIIRFRHE
jgi:hypothetical protein